MGTNITITTDKQPMLRQVLLARMALTILYLGKSRCKHTLDATVQKGNITENRNILT